MSVYTVSVSNVEDPVIVLFSCSAARSAETRRLALIRVRTFAKGDFVRLESRSFFLVPLVFGSRCLYLVGVKKLWIV